MDRALFIFEWTRHWSKVVYLDDNFNVTKIEPFMSQQKFVRPVDMQFGPDRSLYVLEYGETWGVNADARLVRIDYVRGNRPPQVAASTENNIGREPLEVTLSGQGTSDRDASDTLSFEWKLTKTSDPTAKPVTVATTQDAVVTVKDPGVYNAELVVTDSSGASRSASSWSTSTAQTRLSARPAPAGGRPRVGPDPGTHTGTKRHNAGAGPAL